jgi:hypothetical protein
MKTTFAQQAAAAARRRDYNNAWALYERAELQADLEGQNAKARRHGAKAAHFARMDKAEMDSGYLIQS